MIAYGLRAEYAGTVEMPDGPTTVYQGGTTRIDDTRELDVLGALTIGTGTITADDTDAPLIRALDEYPALERLPEAAPPADRARATTPPPPAPAPTPPPEA